MKTSLVSITSLLILSSISAASASNASPDVAIRARSPSGLRAAGPSTFQLRRRSARHRSLGLVDDILKPRQVEGDQAQLSMGPATSTASDDLEERSLLGRPLVGRLVDSLLGTDESSSTSSASTSTPSDGAAKVVKTSDSSTSDEDNDETETSTATSAGKNVVDKVTSSLVSSVTGDDDEEDSTSSPAAASASTPTSAASSSTSSRTRASSSRITSSSSSSSRSSSVLRDSSSSSSATAAAAASSSSSRAASSSARSSSSSVLAAAASQSSLAAASSASQAAAASASLASASAASAAARESSLSAASASSAASVSAAQATTTSSASTTQLLITSSYPGGVTVITSIETLGSTATGTVSAKTSSSTTSTMGKLSKGAIIAIAVSLGSIALIVILFTVIRKRQQARASNLRPLDFNPSGYGATSDAGVTRRSQESWLGGTSITGRPMSGYSEGVPAMEEMSHGALPGAPSRNFYDDDDGMGPEGMVSVPASAYAHSSYGVVPVGGASGLNRNGTMGTMYSHATSGDALSAGMSSRNLDGFTDDAAGYYSSDIGYYDGSAVTGYTNPATRGGDVASAQRAGSGSPYQELQRGSGASQEGHGNAYSSHHGSAYADAYEAPQQQYYQQGPTRWSG